MQNTREVVSHIHQDYQVKKALKSISIVQTSPLLPFEGKCLFLLCCMHFFVSGIIAGSSKKKKNYCLMLAFFVPLQIVRIRGPNFVLGVWQHLSLLSTSHTDKSLFPPFLYSSFLIIGKCSGLLRTLKVFRKIRSFVP